MYNYFVFGADTVCDTAPLLNIKYLPYILRASLFTTIVELLSVTSAHLLTWHGIIQNFMGIEEPLRVCVIL